MFKMLSFGLEEGFELFPPLVNGLDHNCLFQVSPDLNKSLLLLPWKPCSWYSAHTKLLSTMNPQLNGSALCEKSF